MPLDARLIDPRDQTWAEGEPAYRVYFWDSTAACEEWELAGCDVEDALRWAHGSAGGRTFTLYVTVPSPGELGLVRLSGIDPTRDDPDVVVDDGATSAEWRSDDTRTPHNCRTVRGISGSMPVAGRARS